MIIQTAPENAPHLVILQTDHALMSGQFASAFGNDTFAGLSPAAPMIHVSAHHDDGWAAIDARAEQDQNSGLPYHLTQTPLPYLVETSAGSPAANEAHHPYSGILSSMHTVGLFNGRYGLSDKVFIDMVPAEHKPAMQAMLDDELARQARLKAQLAQDPDFADLVTEEMLFYNYKRLQFFDTLALYFHMVHKEARSESQFLNVPRVVGDDVTITIRPVGDGIYSLSPYPFNEPEMTFGYDGRYLSPQPAGTDLKALLENTKPTTEKVILVKG